MIGELADDHVREERRVRRAPREHLRWSRRGDDALFAAAACPFLPMRLLFHKVAGHVLEPARHIHPDVVHDRLAGRTGLIVGGHVDDLDLVLHAGGAPARRDLAALPPAGPAPALLRVGDVAIERRVLARLRLGIDRVGRDTLSEQRVEQQRDLAGVEPLGVAADPLAAQSLAGGS
jgi:hypothetical protein